jgi:hypothetical protein
MQKAAKYPIQEINITLEDPRATSKRSVATKNILLVETIEHSEDLYLSLIKILCLATAKNHHRAIWKRTIS